MPGTISKKKPGKAMKYTSKPTQIYGNKFLKVDLKASFIMTSPVSKACLMAKTSHKATKIPTRLLISWVVIRKDILGVDPLPSMLLKGSNRNANATNTNNTSIRINLKKCFLYISNDCLRRSLKPGY